MHGIPAVLVIHFMWGYVILLRVCKNHIHTLRMEAEKFLKNWIQCRKGLKIFVITYTCRYGPVSLDLSVVVSQTTGPRDSPHRRGSGSGTGPLESVSRGPVPDP